jgi:hypothetical protein
MLVQSQIFKAQHLHCELNVVLHQLSACGFIPLLSPYTQAYNLKLLKVAFSVIDHADGIQVL